MALNPGNRGEEHLDNSGLRIVARSDWHAQPPVAPLIPLVLPVPFVIICHTVNDESQSQVQNTQVRLIQAHHTEKKGWNDIAYNFLIGNDGSVYEGRGWYSAGQHSLNINAKSIGISFMGTYETTPPSNAAITACKNLIAKGVELGVISEGYDLYGHCQVLANCPELPGKMLFELIKTWSHWKPT